MKINKKSIKVNMTMKKLAILLCFILLVPLTAKSQISVMDREYFPTSFIGLTAGIGLTSYSGSVSFYGNQVDCDPYTFDANSEFQVNFLFGLRAEWKIAKQFDLYASLLYEDRSAKFDPFNYQGYVYVSDQKPLEPATLGQELDAKINILSITPMIKYRPFDFDFGILIGPSFALIISDELDSRESIIQPSELVFKPTGGKERTIYSGEIESKNSLLIDLKFGLSYGIMLAERIKLSPEVFYVLPLMNVTSEDDWKISSIQFLLSLSYGL